MVGAAVFPASQRHAAALADGRVCRVFHMKFLLVFDVWNSHSCSRLSKIFFDYKRRQKSIVQYSFDAFVFSHYITGKVKTQEKFFNKQ